MRIRKAKKEDIPEMKVLCQLLIEKEYSDYDKSLSLEWTSSEKGAEDFKEFVTKDNACAIIAETDEGQIVGYVTGKIVKGEDYRKIQKVVEIDSFFILKEHRGNLLGTKIHKELGKWGKDKGAERMRVAVSAGNKQGINFYKKVGLKDYVVVLEGKI